MELDLTAIVAHGVGKANRYHSRYLEDLDEGQAKYTLLRLKTRGGCEKCEESVSEEALQSRPLGFQKLHSASRRS
jgi:hypothetical protein